MAVEEKEEFRRGVESPLRKMVVISKWTFVPQRRKILDSRSRVVKARFDSIFVLVC